MRTSHYNIYVPLPDSDEHILIHGYSGAVDVVQNSVVEFLKGFKEGDSLDDAPLDKATVESLQKRGYLTERTTEQEHEFIRKLGRLLYNVQKKRAGFLLMPTYDCNLRCPYCYEKRLRRNGRAWIQKVMDHTLVDAAYAAMMQIRQDIEDKQPGGITLYGGEPFLKRNAEIVNYIVEKGLELGYKFRAITNGSELDGFLNLLGKEKVSWIQITLDGPPESHDKRRFRADGSGSFADIAKNITAALERGVTVSVRTNVDKTNVEFLPELIVLQRKVARSSKLLQPRFAM
ncbi:MAG TPA: radical SAM protein [Anaerolineae bacterium]|nr:radical SAM protein [Anaerolineae bacterium]